MRLIRKDEKIVAHFTVVGEVKDLEERGEGWVPLYSIGGSEPIGEIESQTYEVHIFDQQTLQNRQVVFLGKETRSAPSTYKEGRMP